MPTYPDLADWNSRRPNDAEDGAAEIAELLAWTSVDQMTAGRVAFETTTIRPGQMLADGTLPLPRPVGGVLSITIDGSPFLDWRMDADGVLQRLDGQAWPVQQDLSLISGTGVFEVTYWHGFRPGRLLIWAAAELAAEFYLAAAGKKCRLPKNVTAVTRQGVSFEMSSPLFSEGRTGIHEVDVVLGRYNPNRLSGQTLVVSPESLARQRRLA